MTALNRLTAARLIDILRASLVLSAAITLGACGGGGSDAASGTDGTGTLTGATAPAIQADREEHDAYTLLLDARSHCGFGTPRVNGPLAQAARNHANWLIINQANTHEETPGTPGYTGTTPLDRVLAVGYPARAVAESIGWGDVWRNTSGVAVRALRGLMAVPYHAIGVLAFDLPEVGLALGPSDGAYAPLVVELAAAGNPGGFVNYEPDEVKTYPCEGSTGVLTRTLPENPNPVPGRDLGTDPTGSAIIVSVASGNRLTLGMARLVHVASGHAVDMLPPVTAANDPNHHLSINMGFLLPAAPLSPNSRYQLTISGANAGMPFTKTLTYQTGPD